MFCQCQIPAEFRTVKTLGESFGRPYFSCKTNTCSFFQWVDSNPLNQRDFQNSMNAYNSAKLPSSTTSSSSSYPSSSSSSSAAASGASGTSGMGSGARVVQSRVSVKLSIIDFSGSPPNAWFAALHAYNATLESFYKTLPESLREYKQNKKFWVFHFEALYESFVHTLTSNIDFNFVDLSPIPTFVVQAIHSFFKKMPRNLPQGNDSVLNVEPELLENLKPFQVEGVKYIISRNGRAFLCDEMGCGKTIQAIAVLQHYRQYWPALIIVPPNLLQQWFDELLKFSGSILKPKDIFIMRKANDLMKHVPKICLVPYSVIDKISDKGTLDPKTFGVVIADESHTIKSKDAKRTTATVPYLKAATVAVCLSGTPALNRPEELYTQLNAILPNVFNDYGEYTKRYCDAKVSNASFNKGSMDVRGSSNESELKLILEGMVMIRRLKEQVIKELVPDKEREVRYVDPDPCHVAELKRLKSDNEELMQKMKICRLEDRKTLENQKNAILSRWCEVTGIAKVKEVQKELTKLIDEARNQRFAALLEHERMEREKQNSAHVTATLHGSDKLIPAVTVDLTADSEGVKAGEMRGEVDLVGENSAHVEDVIVLHANGDVLDSAITLGAEKLGGREGMNSHSTCNTLSSSSSSTSSSSPSKQSNKPNESHPENGVIQSMHSSKNGNKPSKRVCKDPDAVLSTIEPDAIFECVDSDDDTGQASHECKNDNGLESNKRSKESRKMKKTISLSDNECDDKGKLKPTLPTGHDDEDNDLVDTDEEGNEPKHNSCSKILKSKLGKGKVAATSVVSKTNLLSMAKSDMKSKGNAKQKSVSPGRSHVEPLKRLRKSKNDTRTSGRGKRGLKDDSGEESGEGEEGDEGDEEDESDDDDEDDEEEGEEEDDDYSEEEDEEYEDEEEEEASFGSESEDEKGKKKKGNKKQQKRKRAKDYESDSSDDQDYANLFSNKQRKISKRLGDKQNVKVSKSSGASMKSRATSSANAKVSLGGGVIEDDIEEEDNAVNAWRTLLNGKGRKKSTTKKQQGNHNLENDIDDDDDEFDSSFKSKKKHATKGFQNNKSGSTSVGVGGPEPKKYTGLGKKIIVFAHHLNILDMLEDFLRDQELCYIRIDGKVTTARRSVLVKQFQEDDKTDVALLAIQACGTGLNLTRANVALFAELHWSAGTILQAEDRIHRIGQTSLSVRIIYVLCRGSSDEVMWETLQSKHNMIGRTVGIADNNPTGMFVNRKLNDKVKGQSTLDTFLPQPSVPSSLSSSTPSTSSSSSLSSSSSSYPFELQSSTSASNTNTMSNAHSFTNTNTNAISQSVTSAFHPHIHNGARLNPYENATTSLAPLAPNNVQERSVAYVSPDQINEVVYQQTNNLPIGLPYQQQMNPSHVSLHPQPRPESLPHFQQQPQPQLPPQQLQTQPQLQLQQPLESKQINCFPTAHNGNHVSETAVPQTAKRPLTDEQRKMIEMKKQQALEKKRMNDLRLMQQQQQPLQQPPQPLMQQPQLQQQSQLQTKLQPQLLHAHQSDQRITETQRQPTYPPHASHPPHGAAVMPEKTFPPRPIVHSVPNPLPLPQMNREYQHQHQYQYQAPLSTSYQQQQQQHQPATTTTSLMPSIPPKSGLHVPTSASANTNINADVPVIPPSNPQIAVTAPRIQSGQGFVFTTGKGSSLPISAQSVAIGQNFIENQPAQGRVKKSID